MKNRQYHGVQLSKKESELIQWLQRGENGWFDAYYVYAGRKKSRDIIQDRRKQMSWFNNTLANLKKKSLCVNIPFITPPFPWMNPGVEASKANLVALSVQEHNNFLKEQKKVI